MYIAVSICFHFCLFSPDARKANEKYCMYFHFNSFLHSLTVSLLKQMYVFRICQSLVINCHEFCVFVFSCFWNHFMVKRFWTCLCLVSSNYTIPYNTNESNNTSLSCYCSIHRWIGAAFSSYPFELSKKGKQNAFLFNNAKHQATYEHNSNNSHTMIAIEIVRWKGCYFNQTIYAHPVISIIGIKKIMLSSSNVNNSNT